MRRVLAALLSTAALAAPAGAQAAPARWTPDVAAARRWAGHRAGVIAFAVRTGEHVWGVGLDRTFPSASVVKAMLLVAYLRRDGVRGRDLTAAERALLDPMIRRSDNAAASRVFRIVGTGGLARLARVVGMTRFATNPVWGLSRISARDQTRFFLHVDARVPARHRAYAMELLRTIIPSQRWGIARAIPPGWTLYFKSGWGSGSGAVDHQIGLLRQGEERVSVAVLTLANPSQRYGTHTEEGIAARLLHGLAGTLVGTAGPVYAAGVPGAARPRARTTEGAPQGALASVRRGSEAYSSAAGGSTAG